jgi:hypothetical protein
VRKRLEDASVHAVATCDRGNGCPVTIGKCAIGCRFRHSLPPSGFGVTSRAPSAGRLRSPDPENEVRGYLFDAFGPYPIVGAALAAGINQGDNTPPEWKQGAEAYGKRFGSDFGIAGITTTTRYALASAFREDTLYYGCQCKGVLPRLSHALISTFSARRGDNGHRVFSMAAVVAPYAGTMAAVYGWYPDRYGAKDALRMGELQPTWICGREYRAGIPLRRTPLFAFSHPSQQSARSAGFPRSDETLGLDFDRCAIGIATMKSQVRTRGL